MPLVSVITAAYNAAPYIEDTIRSVLRQTFSDWEYIVVDDGSCDDTGEIVRRFPRVRYLYQPNRGVAAARNTALAYANGKYVAIVDSDDLWMPTKLARQLAAFRSNPDAGLCCTNANTISESGEVLTYRRLPGNAIITYQHALTRAHHIVTSSVMFNRRYLGDHPYLIDLPPCEDYHVNLTVLYRSGPGIFLDEALVQYRQRSNSLSHSSKLRWVEQNERAVLAFLNEAEGICPLPRGLRRRAVGHLACQRAQANIIVGGNLGPTIACLLKALLMNRSDALCVVRQCGRLLLTMNRGYSA